MVGRLRVRNVLAIELEGALQSADGKKGENGTGEV
jgi:hypothetical protein